MENKVLITGGLGFIGSHLLKLYPNARILDLLNNQDICDQLPDEDFNLIFHLAAKHHIASCENEAEECIRINCWGTLNLIKSYPNARIISISSSAANDIKSVYGASKLFTEIVGKLHKNYLSIRLYNVFGEGQRPESGVFVPKLIKSFYDKVPLTINGDGLQSRDFTYVGDVVQNLKKLAESSRTGLAHIGYGKTISILDMIKLVYGKLPNLTHNPANEIDIRFSQSPEPCISYIGRERGLKLTMEWFKNEFYKT